MNELPKDALQTIQTALGTAVRRAGGVVRLYPKASRSKYQPHVGAKQRWKQEIMGCETNLSFKDVFGS
jgi:hypothetical protein